jgi:predicted ester cyclase
MTDPVDTYLDVFATLTPETLHRLDEVTAEAIRFRDPFHEVVGRDALRRVLARMFTAIPDARFTILHRAGDRRICLVLWRFEGHLGPNGRALRFDGTSVLHLDDAGRVDSHVDHWDAAAVFYEPLPVIGPILRWIRRRIAA